MVDTLHRLGGWKWRKVFPHERMSHLHFTVGSMLLTPLYSSRRPLHYLVAAICFDCQPAVFCHAEVEKLSAIPRSLDATAHIWLTNQSFWFSGSQKREYVPDMTFVPSSKTPYLFEGSLEQHR